MAEKDSSSIYKVKTANYSVITFLLFWCALIVVSSVYVTTPLVGEYAEIFDVTQSLAVWTSSVFSFFYAIGFLFFGPLADRYGRKEIIVFGLTALSIITFAIGFTDHFYLLILLRGIQGFVAASFAPTALAYAFELYPKRKLATAVGFLSFGYVAAGIFGQVIADLIKQTFDWQAVFLLFGVFYLVSLFAVLFTFPNIKESNKRNELRKFISQIKKIFMQRDFLICYSITILLLLTFIGMYTVLGSYLSNTPFNLSDKEILSIRAVGILGMLLSPVAGIFIKRYGMIEVLRFGLIIAVIGLFLLGFFANIILIVMMSILFVAGISLIFPAIMMLVGVLGGAQRAVANSIYAFILFIGATLGPVIAISINDATGSYLITFGALSFILAIGLILSFCIKSIKGQTHS